MAARKNPEFYELFGHLSEQPKAEPKKMPERRPVAPPAPAPAAAAAPAPASAPAPAPEPEPLPRLSPLIAPPKPRQPAPPSPFGGASARPAAPPAVAMKAAPVAEPKAEPARVAPATPPKVEMPKPAPIRREAPPKAPSVLTPPTPYNVPKSGFGGGGEGLVLTRDKLAALGVLVVALIVGAFLLGVMVGGRTVRRGGAEDQKKPADAATAGVTGGATAGTTTDTVGGTHTDAGTADAAGATGSAGSTGSTGSGAAGGTETAGSGTTTDAGVTATVEPEYIYKLQIIGAITQRSAQDVGAFLARQNYDDVRYGPQANGRYVVYVGTFDSPTSPEALKFQETFRNMEYLYGKPFKDCFFTRFKK